MDAQDKRDDGVRREVQDEMGKRFDESVGQKKRRCTWCDMAHSVVYNQAWVRWVL